jgi:amphi-Trp domain-containing protein
MSEEQTVDIEKTYPLADFVAKIRRLADCLENGEQFEIQIAGHRLYVPVHAIYNIEYEREDGASEIEFQIKWQNESDEEEAEDADEDMDVAEDTEKADNSGH